MNSRVVISSLALLLPWSLRRRLLVRGCGYCIHKTARIGFSLVCPNRLEMGPGSRIGHLTACRPGVELLRLGDHAQIGNLNWITATPLKDSAFFSDVQDRRPELLVHDEAAITNRHYLDCTASVSIGRFSIFAGCHSQIMSHSIDLAKCRQGATPISIGEFCFVGTASLLLPGAGLPDYSVLGANSLLNKAYTDPYFLYAGSPARPVKPLSAEMKYFTRAAGVVE